MAFLGFRNAVLACPGACPSCAWVVLALSWAPLGLPGGPPWALLALIFSSFAFASSGVLSSGARGDFLGSRWALLGSRCGLLASPWASPGHFFGSLGVDLAYVASASSPVLSLTSPRGHAAILGVAIWHSWVSGTLFWHVPGFAPAAPGSSSRSPGLLLGRADLASHGPHSD